MKKVFAHSFFLFLFVSYLAYAECGDDLCGAGENTTSCPAGCKEPVKASEERIVSRGPEIRASNGKLGILVASVAIENGSAILRFTVLNQDGREIFNKDILARPLTGKGDLGNPHPIQGPDGTIYIAFRDHLRDDPGIPIFRLRVVSSTDGGHNWNFLKENSDSDGVIDIDHTGVWEPFLFFDANNDLRVVYAKERSAKLCLKQHNKKQDIVTKVSTDHGRTWVSETVAASEGVSRDGVPSVSRLKDGSYVLIFESWRVSACGNANPHLLIRSMQSRDGVSWSKRSIVFDPPANLESPSIATWPFVSTLSDGRVIASFTSNYLNPNGGTDAPMAPEVRKDFDTFLLLSNGGPGFDKLVWDQHSLTRAFSFSRDSAHTNRYSSLAPVGPNAFMVFSGQPGRFVIFNY